MLLALQGRSSIMQVLGLVFLVERALSQESLVRYRRKRVYIALYMHIPIQEASLQMLAYAPVDTTIQDQAGGWSYRHRIDRTVS